MNKVYKVEITPKTIIITLSLLGFVWLLAKIYSVIFLVFIAFAISAMLSPIIDYLQTKKIPRALSIAFIYILFLTSIVLLVLISYKPLITQLEAFVRELPDIIINVVNALLDRVPFLKEQFNWDEIFANLKESFIQESNFSQYLIGGLGKAFGLVGSVFSALVNILAILVLSIYFIQFKEGSKEKFIKLVPSKHQDRIFNLINKMESQIGAWLRAQILLMLTIGTFAWSGLEIIGMEFSIPMGIIAGLLEAVPGIGPMITWILAIIVAAGSNVPFWKIIFIAIWFILIQQLENYLIVPKLMERYVGANPVITIIAILGGAKIFGVWGTLLAVPAVAITQIALRYYIEYRRKPKKK